MHFPNYFKFFERTEEEFYRHLGLNINDVAERGIWLPPVEAFCQYKKPARFNDLLEVELNIEEMREKSVKYGFKIFNKESAVLLAKGYVIVLAADKKARKTVQIPKEIVEKLKTFRSQGMA